MFVGNIFLEPWNLTFYSIGVIGNTTCAAKDLVMTNSHLNDLDFILEQYGGRLFVFQMCPPSLFAEIVKINHLRMRATRVVEVGSLSQEAYTILNRVDEFSPEQWAQSKPSSQKDWMLLGTVYQLAVSLYCISSLQSLSALPRTASLAAHRTASIQSMHVFLQDALSSPKIKRLMLWPLVVLGVQAVNGNALLRVFVKIKLSELSRHIGIASPLAAKSVLERYWKSGETDWDKCFDKPYAFVTQFAVNVEQILPLN